MSLNVSFHNHFIAKTFNGKRITQKSAGFHLQCTEYTRHDFIIAFPVFPDKPEKFPLIGEKNS